MERCYLKIKNLKGDKTMKHTKQEQEGYNALEVVMCKLAQIHITLRDTFTAFESKTFDQARNTLSDLFLNAHKKFKAEGKHIITITGQDIQNIR